MKLINRAIPAVIFPILFFICGCNESAKVSDSQDLEMKSARLRWGAFFGSPFGMKYTNPDYMGTHKSQGGAGEINGLLYTCKGGFIDVGHVREAADRTAYVKGIIFKSLMENKTDVSFQVIEPSQYWLTISYPSNWNRYSQAEKESIANELSIEAGQFIGHQSMIWHEIITWYGFASTGVFSDQISSFSWEDPYSDVMGTYLGAAALRDMGQNYDEAVARLLNEELKELDVQPASVCKQAVKQIRGLWYTGGGYFFVHMRMRNFDVGYDDGMLAPVRVPGICSDCEAKLYPAPKLESLWRYGFGMTIELDPRILQKDKIYDAINLEHNKRIQLRTDFARVVEQIRNDKEILAMENETKTKIANEKYKQR
ncbi:MAG: hypothetical protein A2Y12_11575 [Planctomycetes bacterium GWF2_42_9]|nr:MAG: hypothetical protein A2Y12_11575 [Planctomycetes bacterium GWF2_42_9]